MSLKKNKVVEKAVSAMKAGECLPAVKAGLAGKAMSSLVNTVFTRGVVTAKPFYTKDSCIGCGKCIDACPAKALTGKVYTEGTEREEIINPEKCSEYMKREFKHIGRGAVCGICMKVCPYGK